MTLRQSTRQFFFYGLQNGKSKSTCRKYRSILEDFETFFGDLSLARITPHHLQGYLADPANSELSAGSRNGIKSAFKSFFNWCVDSGLIAKNPTKLLQMEKNPQKEARFLSSSDVSKLRKVIENPRDNLLIEFALQTGLRLSEIQSLNIGHVRGRSSFQIVGKGSKSRVVYLSQDLQNLIRQNVNGGPPDEPLFVSQRGDRISKSQIATLFKRYCRIAGLKGFSFHSLRHSFITEVFRKTKNIRIAQELAGHSNIQTTARYSHITAEDKKDAIRNLFSGN